MVGSEITMARPSTSLRIQTNVRLPVETLDRLRAEAELRQVSVNYLIERAVADWIDAHALRRTP